MAMPPLNSNDPSKTTPDSEQPYHDARVIRDLEGIQWFAHEVGAGTLGAGEPCLLLVSIREVRRIAPVPSNWRSLTSEGLLSLRYARL